MMTGNDDSAVGYLLFFLNGILSMAGAVLIMAGAKSKLGCGLLLAAIVLQIFMFTAWLDHNFFAK